MLQLTHTQRRYIFLANTNFYTLMSLYFLYYIFLYYLYITTMKSLSLLNVPEMHNPLYQIHCAVLL